jgi:hypothetical protein
VTLHYLSRYVIFFEEVEMVEVEEEASVLQWYSVCMRNLVILLPEPRPIRGLMALVKRVGELEVLSAKTESPVVEVAEVSKVWEALYCKSY